MQDSSGPAPGVRRTFDRIRHWPAILLASTGVAVFTGAFPMSPLLRLAASMWFLIICPGMACAGLLDIADALPKYLLAIGF